MEALSCSGQAVQKVRLDFGWEGALEGEGIEGVEMEWNALCYDITVSVHGFQSVKLAAVMCSVAGQQLHTALFGCSCAVAMCMSGQITYNELHKQPDIQTFSCMIQHLQLFEPHV